MKAVRPSEICFHLLPKKLSKSTKRRPQLTHRMRPVYRLAAFPNPLKPPMLSQHGRALSELIDAMVSCKPQD